MTEEKSPVDQVLDLFVFAPLGLAMTARSELPDLVAKGRAQIEGQVSLARFVGQFALKQGKVEAEKLLRPFLLGQGEAPSEPAASSVPATSTLVSQPTPVDLVPPVNAQPAAPAPAADDLAIPGYDSLSASQVVQRLAGLSSAELEQVRAYESATRRRMTVLTKITQLQ